MTTYTTPNQSVQHFSDGYTTVVFTRPVTSLFITTATGSTRKISFDGGRQYMDLPAGVMVPFYHLHQARIDLLGSGVINGMGYAC